MSLLVGFWSRRHLSVERVQRRIDHRWKQAGKMQLANLFFPRFSKTHHYNVSINKEIDERGQASTTSEIIAGYPWELVVWQLVHVVIY